MTPSFWLILLAVLGYGLLHSILASLRTKALARHWFGPQADRWFRIFYNLIAIVTLLPILILPILLIDKPLYRIPFPWVVLTLAIQAAAAVVGLYVLRQTGISNFLGMRQLLLPEITSPTRFVRGGFYKYVRHPLYTAGLVFIWLLPIMTCNLLALNIGLTVYLLVGAIFEERKLLTEFGEAYAKYRKQTPMLIPFMHFPRKSL